MKCLSNLRQIGIGCWGYSNENKNVFPPAWSGASDWGVIINAYMSASGKAPTTKRETVPIPKRCFVPRPTSTPVGFILVHPFWFW